MDEALGAAHGVLSEHGFPDTLTRQLQRTVTRCQLRTPENMLTAIAGLQELSASICDVMAIHGYVLVSPSEKENFDEPLKRFGDAAIKFPAAARSMAGASRCYALAEWDAAVFHSMSVLEHSFMKILAARITV